MAQITIENDGAVAVVRFTNPPDGFMNNATVPEITAMLDQVEADDDVRAVVLTGGLPDVFIRHFSVVELEERARSQRAEGIGGFDLTHPIPERDLHRDFRRIEDSPKPFVAAINGTAMGGGFELALRCDFRIAQDGPYSIGLPEINIGILPGAGGTQRLSRIIGQAKTLELTLLGKTLSPREAAEYGLVTECVEGSALDRAMEIARELTTKSPHAVAYIKHLVRRSELVAPMDGLAAERTLFADLLVRDEAVELMTEMNQGKRDIRDR
ncbi:MAG: enoyl-CoA hydratase/isomerase family protein [Alphaproteobacteria bacterium]|jgi:enoyl-CoA hydratase|nr:enoyl-CoA hydratase/isomerase family protein [Alphaproteobacteria bacterium]